MNISQFLVSLLGGGLAGSILSLLFTYIKDRHSFEKQQNETMSAFFGEIKYCKALCEFNSKESENYLPFIFPSNIAKRVSFEEREKFPKLNEIMNNLENYSLALLRINQLITLYQNNLLDPHPGGTKGENDKLRKQIIELCNGSRKLENVGAEGFIYLNKFLDSTFELVKAKI